MKKKLLIISAFCILISQLFISSFAAVDALIVDNRQKISENGLAALEKYAREISDKYQMDVAFFLSTNEYAPEKKLSEYTRERFLGIRNGFVLVHDEEGKLWSVVKFGTAQQWITEEAEDQFWASYDAQQKYYDGVMDYLAAAESYLEAYSAALPAPVTSILERVERDPGSFALLVDDAGLLSESEAAALLEKLTALSAKWKNDIVIVTVDSIGGAKPVEFADDWFDYGGYGQGEDFDGLLLLINMEERDWYISTCGYGITAFTDAGIQFLGKQLKSDGLSDGDYAKAFNSFTDWCDKFFIQAETGKPFDVGNLPKTTTAHVALVLIGFGGGFLIAWLVVAQMEMKLKSVKQKHAAADYVRPGSMQLLYQNDQFLYKNVVRTKIETSSSSGGGGSSTHSSSSGSTHGGGGGKF